MTRLNKQLVFFVLFTLLGFASLQIPFNKLAGANVSFTLFDFLAPIAGAFLGPIYGVASVLGVEVFNNLIKQTPWTTGTLIRLFPTLFAVYFFATVKKGGPNKRSLRELRSLNWILAVPFIAILAFLAHPNGRQVPEYTLFWIIPLVAYRFRNNLYMRSLGATFTAHAVGGAAWIWAFNLPAAVWQALIPVVISERLLFAAGIAGSFLIMKYTLNYLISKGVLPKISFSL